MQSSVLGLPGGPWCQLCARGGAATSSHFLSWYSVLRTRARLCGRRSVSLYSVLVLVVPARNDPWNLKGHNRQSSPGNPSQPASISNKSGGSLTFLTRVSGTIRIDGGKARSSSPAQEQARLNSSGPGERRCRYIDSLCVIRDFEKRMRLVQVQVEAELKLSYGVPSVVFVLV